MIHPHEPKTIQEAIRYIRQCVDAVAEGKPKETIAANIVGIIHAEDEQLWYDSDEDFAEIFEIAANMEWQNTLESETSDWAELLERLERLEKRYISN